MKIRTSILIFIFLVISLHGAFAGEKGYYRFPSLHGNLVVFTAEGDLWQYNQTTKVCMRITTNQGVESNASLSPDGKLIAFNAEYEGPDEVYIIPTKGGIPKRMTWEGLQGGAAPKIDGWTTDGKLIVSTSYYSGLPQKQLALVDTATTRYSLIPLAQADEGAFDDSGNLYFTRLSFQGSHTKRYKGGTAQNLWKFDGKNEAVPLTSDYAGTSKNPMFYQGRLYFLTDRDGTMNLWSMQPDGTGLQQLTHSSGWDLKDAQLQAGNVIYQKKADLYIYHIASGNEKLLDISLVSDFDQRRLVWEKDPEKKIRSLAISKDGSHVALVSAGRVFCAPADGSRWVEVTRKYGVRYKQAEFNGDDDKVVFLSDESGEMELWETSGDGLSPATQLTSGSTVLIMNQQPSPNGKYIAYTEKDYALKLYNRETKKSLKIDQDSINGFSGLTWSPDSKWLAYSDPSDNELSQIKVMNIENGQSFYLTSNRVENYSPVFSPDGKWLYFISDRTFNSKVMSPWGLNQPEPYYDKMSKIYMLALYDGERSPFIPDNELTPKEEKKDSTENKGSSKKRKKKEEAKEEKVPDMAGATRRLYEVPVPADNISGLKATKKYLYWLQSDAGDWGKRKLFALEISNKKKNDPVEVTDDVRGFELSGDGNKILIRKNNGIYVTGANGKKADLKDDKVTLKDWAFRVDPVENRRQMLVDAWRLERDYFYDKNMNGVDWKAVLDRHLPLVNRVTDRYELDDLMASMVSELSALHIFVYGGDKRTSQDQIGQGSLGARLEKDTLKGGYVIARIYNGDPDFPEERSPLSQPQLQVKTGDVITKINGVNVLGVENINQLLSQKEEVEVRLSLKDKDGREYDQIVKPVSMGTDADLRYSDWEYTRRQYVEKQTGNDVGYLHLRAMSGDDFDSFVKGYYPVFNRQGLIIDVRNNRGGNIDSWILSRLLRKAWFYWQSRAGKPTWNMQYAFRGHIVVLCNEKTASDGEAFSEGVKRLNIGKVIGTRTWGGEIWLTSSNRLVDGGIATAAEMGVYTDDGKWIIEGHGVDPDIVVDNLPYSTYNGKDAQLDAAISYLKKKIAEDPVPVPKVPPFPDKSVNYKE